MTTALSTTFSGYLDRVLRETAEEQERRKSADAEAKAARSRAMMEEQLIRFRESMGSLWPAMEAEGFSVEAYHFPDNFANAEMERCGLNLHDPKTERIIEIRFESGRRSQNSDRFVLKTPDIDRGFSGKTLGVETSDLPRMLALCIAGVRQLHAEHAEKMAKAEQDRKERQQRENEEQKREAEELRLKEDRDLIRQRAASLEYGIADRQVAAIHEREKAAAWRWPWGYVYTYYRLAYNLGGYRNEDGEDCFDTKREWCLQTPINGDWNLVRDKKPVRVRLMSGNGNLATGLVEFEERTASQVSDLPGELREPSYAEVQGFQEVSDDVFKRDPEDQIRLYLGERPIQAIRVAINGDARIPVPASFEPATPVFPLNQAAEMLASLIAGPEEVFPVSGGLLKDRAALEDAWKRIQVAGIDLPVLKQDLEAAYATLVRHHESLKAS